MKKILLISFLASFLVLPAMTLALVDCAGFNETQCSASASCTWNPAVGKCQGLGVEAGGDIITVINKIGNWMFAILSAVAGLMMVIAAFYFVMAQGDEKKIGTGRNMLMYALIGVAVALGARGLITIVTTILTAG